MAWLVAPALAQWVREDAPPGSSRSRRRRAWLLAPCAGLHETLWIAANRAAALRVELILFLVARAAPRWRSFSRGR